MGYIKEPEGIDFIIQSPPLTEEERDEISRFIKEYKAKNKHEQHQKKRRTSVRRHTSARTV